MMGTLLQDIRYGFRMLWKSPGFTAVAVIMLALGIGANSAIFSGVSAFILRPLPVEQPDRIVRLFEIYGDDNSYNDFSYPDYVDYRDQAQSFEGIFGYRMVQAALSNNEQNDLIWGELVSGNYFDVLHVRPTLGRAFLPEEDKAPGSHPVVVLGHSLWQRRFASDPKLVGQTVNLNGQAYTVIGIAPPEFMGTKFALSMDFWVPMMMQAQIMRGDNARLERRGDHWFGLMGRLKSGVTPEQAATELTTIAQRLEQAYPGDREKNVRVITNIETEGRFEEESGTVRLGAGLALGLIGVVLLIACANVANLLLARAVTRRKEIGIRLALGASRIRLIRQLLTESMMLSVMGGILGLLLAFWITDWMMSFIPVLPYTFSFTFSPDWRALSFTLIISLLTGVVFGLAPALQASNPDVVPVLKGETLAPKAGRFRSFTLRNALVISQIALSLVVLVCGALLVRSASHAQAIDPGFTTDNVLVLSVNPSLLGYTDEQGKQFYKQLVERVESLPGVQSASVASLLPLGDSASSRGPVLPEGQEEPPPGSEGGTVLTNFVGPKHFETLRIPLLQGRDFTLRDEMGAPGVIIINETLARRLWPGQEAVGKRLRIGKSDAPYLEVIGVAKDGKYRSIGEKPRPYMYLPMMQSYRPAMTLVVRTAGDPTGIVSAVRHEVQSLEARLPVYDIKTMKEHMTYALWATDMGAKLSTAFGLLALLLAATGLYSVMAYSVSQRTKEIGIRMALGAQASDVLKLVTKQGMALALIGVAIGLAGAFVATRILSSLLYGVGVNDAVTFIGIPLLLAVVALVACYIPARRATKVDPMVALRYE